MKYLNKENKLDEDIQKRIEYFPLRDHLDEGGKKSTRKRWASIRTRRIG